MDLITRNLKRTVSSAAAATSINYYTSNSSKDNISNTTIFTTQRTEQLTVPPYTNNTQTKVAETSNFSTFTETPYLVPMTWGAGANKHAQFALWYKDENPNFLQEYTYAVNDNNSIIVAHKFDLTKIKVSTDGGSTWVDSTSTFPGYFAGSLFYSEQKFWMIYFNGQGAWTSTDGMTWVTGGTSNYSNDKIFGTPNFTVAFSSTWNGSSYNVSFSTIKNNVATAGPSTTSPNPYLAVANKTSGYNNLATSLAVMRFNAYRLTWSGTAATVTDLGSKFIGKYVSAIYYDEVNNRWLALALPYTNWTSSNEIYESLDDGDNWTLVTSVPDAYSNKATIFTDLVGRIIISGNAIGIAIYNEISDTWIAGDDVQRVNSIRQLGSNSFIINSMNWNDPYGSKVSIVTMPTLAEGPLFTNRKWHGYTSGTGSIIQHFSTDGYLSYTNVTPTFLNAGYEPYIPGGNTGPSYITRSTPSIHSRATAGVNYDKIHYLMTTDNSDEGVQTSRPFATVNVWRSEDSGNTYNRTGNFAYNPTYYDTNSVNFTNSTGLPAWTDATAPTNNEICYSRLIAEPTISTSSNIANRINSLTPASINNMIYQDSAFWAWGHNGLLMTSPNEGTSVFEKEWVKFETLQDLCLGSRIINFWKEGSKLFVFTNLNQCLVSLDLGVTWLDRSAGLRTALSQVTAAYNGPMIGNVLSCVYAGGKIIIVTLSALYESSDDGVTWTKNTIYNPSIQGNPCSIAKHPTSDIIIIGTYQGTVRITTSALTSFTGMFILTSTNIPIGKIIWAGTRWYVFYDNNTTNYGRYAYSNTLNPTALSNWVTPVATGGSTALPSAEYIGGVGSTAVTTNAYWDGTRMIVTDYVNNQVYISEGTTNTWQNISNGIRAYSDSVLKTKLKHVWTVASNGTMLVASGDMCETVASTPANALAGTKWSLSFLKRESGVEDPEITYETEVYVANVSIVSAGSGYSANGTSSMLYNLTLNCANPSKPNGGVKPRFENSATNNTNGGIGLFVTIANGGYTHGYTGTESTTCTLSGGTGSGFVGALNFRRKPTNVRIKKLGRGFGPMNVTSPTYVNDGACAEVYFMGNPSTFVPSSVNICPMKVNLAERISTNFPSTVPFGAFVQMYGNDEDGFLYAKSRMPIFSVGTNRTASNSRFSNSKTTSRASFDKGVTWFGNFFHKTVKPLYMSSTDMNLMNNVGFPLIEFLSEHQSRAEVYLTEGGLIYESEKNKILYSGWNLESNGSTIEVYPFLIPAAFSSDTLKIDDSRTNLLASIKNDFVITLSGTQLQQFANTTPANQLGVYPNIIQYSDNAVSETSLANTMIVALAKPKTQVGTNSGRPQSTLDDIFWYKSTNKGVAWTDISAPIRTAVNSLVVPSGTTSSTLVQYAPMTFRWSADDNLWFTSSVGGIAYWTSPDLATWTVVQDPASLFPQYPN